MIQFEYENSSLSNHKLAEKHNVSEKSIRNWSKANGWVKKSAASPQEVRAVPVGKIAEEIVANLAAEARSETPNETFPLASDLSRKFCATVEVLQAELDTAIRNLHLLEEIAEVELDHQEASVVRRRLVEKILSLPGLVKAANDITAALSRLRETDPGKKEQQQEAAVQIGQKSRFATPDSPSAYN